MANSSIWQSNEIEIQEHAVNVSLLRILNAAMVRLMTPAVVYITMLMILGLVGNPLVCYYYIHTEQKSSHTFFIVVLTFYDLITCAVSMPAAIADLAMYYTFENNIACKILRFVNYFSAIASMLTLVAIASDRYKRICHVTRPQMDVHQARRVSGITILLSSLLALPAFFIYGVNRVPIVDNSTLAMYGHTCTMTTNVAYRVYVWTYAAGQFFCFVVLLTVLIVLYCLIGRSLYYHSKRLKSLYKKKPNGRELCTYSDAENITSTVFSIEDGHTQMDEIRSDEPVKTVFCSNDVEIKIKNKFSEATPEIKDTKIANIDAEKFAGQYQAESKKVMVPRKTRHYDDKTVRVTIVMLVVTVVFIISFLPYLSLAAWRAFEGRHGALFLSEAGLVAFNIGLNSYLLNSSLNPFVYGIFNSRLRRFYFGWCFKKHDEV